MNNLPEISVIVPVYKVEKYLPQCIDSILAQTFTDFELLLVDDGSPDRCGEICEEYAGKDTRIRVFHQANAGLSCARNTGLMNACGRYVTFIDSDDYVKPCYLERLYGALPADKTKEGVIVGSLDAYLPNGDFQTFHVPEQELALGTDVSCADRLDRQACCVRRQQAIRPSDYQAIPGELCAFCFRIGRYAVYVGLPDVCGFYGYS